MAKEKLNLEALEGEANVENTATVSAEDAAKAAEKQALVEAGLDKISSFGVSTKMTAIIDLARVWDVAGKEEKAAAKETAFEALGGAEAAKEYLTGEFVEEVEGLRGIVPAISVLNTIYHFYKPRTSKGGSKAKKATILLDIDGTSYNVLESVFQATASLPREERIKALLEDAGTVKAVVAEVL